MMPGKAKWCAVWLLVLMVAGCEAKLRDTRSFEVKPGDAGKEYRVDPKASERVLKVTATAEGGPIEVYVYLSKDRDVAENSILAKKDEGILAKAVKVQEAELTATIPANEEAAVVVTTGDIKSANVQLTMED